MNHCESKETKEACSASTCIARLSAFNIEQDRQWVGIVFVGLVPTSAALSVTSATTGQHE